MNTLSRILRALRSRASKLKAALRKRRDSWLHPGRHRRAKDQLRRLPRPRRIVVICHGNICRSPYLQIALSSSLRDVEVASAGFVGPGRVAPENATAVASRRGVNLSSHRSQLLTKEILAHADLVIAMDDHQARFVARHLGFPTEKVLIAGDLDPATGQFRVIRDPWRQPIEVFEASYDRLDRCAAIVVEILRQDSA